MSFSLPSLFFALEFADLYYFFISAYLAIILDLRSFSRVVSGCQFI